MKAMNKIETTKEHQLPNGTVIEHSVLYPDGVAFTQYKPYTAHFYTAIKDNVESKPYHAKGHARNWLKKMEAK